MDATEIPIRAGRSESLPFGNLPAEILVKIFKQVDFRVLLALSEDPHLKNFTFVRQVIQWLDFCSAEPLDGPKILKFISLSTRSSHIEKICLNNVGNFNCRLNRIFLSIPRWKCLKTLHVAHCGLDVNQIFDILKELNQIEEVSWSLFKDENGPTTVTPIFRPSSSKRSKMLYNGGFNVKVINLDLLCSHIQLLGLLDFLRQFPKLETLRIHVYHFNFLTFASAIPYSSYNEAAVEFPLLTSFFLTSDNHDTRETTDSTLTSRCRCISSVINSVVLENSPSAKPWKEFVSVNSDNSRLEKDYKAISEFPPKTMHIQRRPLELTASFTDWILAPGDSIENLSLFSCTFCGTNSERILPRILSKCINIRELNMEDTEWVNFELCAELKNLKRLRKLVIPDSAWNRPPLKTNEKLECINCSRSSGSNADGAGGGGSRPKRRRLTHSAKTVQTPLLIPLVNNCQLLTELEIRHTKLLFKNQAVLSEIDYASISKLPNLKKLTIVKSEGVQNGAFLIPIAEQCVLLESLRLHHLGHKKAVCSYWDKLIEALPKMANLKVLSLHHNNLTIDKEILWLALTKLSQLRQLCLGSNLNTSVNVNQVLSFFSKADKLDVFHLHSKIKNFKALTTKLKQNEKIRAQQLSDLIIQSLPLTSDITEINGWLLSKGYFRNKSQLCAARTDIARGIANCGLYHD